MVRRVLGTVAGLALLAGGLFAGMSLAGSDGLAEPRELAAPAVLEPVTGVQARETGQRAKARRKKGPVIDFFYSRAPVEAGFVQPIRCPRRAGNPIGGGARTSQGIVVGYLSRANPATGATPPRTYFVGVDALPGADPEAAGLIEVQCAKGLKVKD